MNLNIVKKLLKVANNLDKNSFYKEADVLDSIIKKAIAVKQELTFKKPKELEDYQKEELYSILDEADSHEEFSALVKSKKNNANMIVFLWGDDVAGFLIPKKQNDLGKGKNRIGAMFVSKNFRGLGISQKAIKIFVKNNKNSPK